MATLLNIVQDIMSDMDADEINSIGETIESTQIARVVRQVYDSIVDEQQLTNVKRLYQLEGLADLTKPATMKMPDDAITIEQLRYDARGTIGGDPTFRDVSYLHPKSFLDRANQMAASDTNVTEVRQDGVKFNVYNDRTPQYWTTFDDTYVNFDSYNGTVDDTLHADKTQCYGEYKRELAIADSTEIDLPRALEGHLRNEARSLCFDLFKDGTTPKVEQMARRSRVRTQRLRQKAQLNQERDNLPDYGRRRAGRRTLHRR